MVMSQLQTQNRTEPTTTDAHRSARTNRTAIWALVLAILTLGGVGSVLGIVLGARARTQVRGSGERGAGMAMAAIVVGILTLLVAIGYWIVIAQHVGGSGGGGSGGGGGY
jgi:hypothetical protein